MKVLIISSNHTGHGHKSITEALCEQFKKHTDISVSVVDGFTLGGSIGIRMGKLYGSLTRNARDLYKLVWDMSCKGPKHTNEFIELMIEVKFLKLIRRVKPDTIISTHPSFIGSVLSLMEKHNIRANFMTVVADIASITPLWADKRADITICPTEEAKLKCIEFGVPENKTAVTGFPIRERFCECFRSGFQRPDYDLSKPLECLVMSGGEGSGNMKLIAKTLLKNFNCRVRIITGRNASLKKRLENTLKEHFADRLEVYGFTENIQELMASSDIAFTRGSPNTMLEAVLCNVPLIITGALPGQEEANPLFAEKHNLAVICSDLKKLKPVVQELLSDNGAALKAIRASQRSFASPDAAVDIVSIVLGMKPRDAYRVGAPILGGGSVKKLGLITDIKASIYKLNNFNRAIRKRARKLKRAGRRHYNKNIRSKKHA